MWIKHQRDGHTHTSAQITSKWHSGAPTHLNTPHKRSPQIKSGTGHARKEERFANWLDQPRRKGFKYHWKWGQCDCITSGSAEPVECLWWPSNSILRIVCIMSRVSLHHVGSPAGKRFQLSSPSSVVEGICNYPKYILPLSVWTV